MLDCILNVKYPTDRYKSIYKCFEITVISLHIDMNEVYTSSSL